MSSVVISFDSALATSSTSAGPAATASPEPSSTTIPTKPDALRDSRPQHPSANGSLPFRSVPRRVVVRGDRWRLYDDRAPPPVQGQAHQQSQRPHRGKDPAHQLQVYT